MHLRSVKLTRIRRQISDLSHSPSAQPTCRRDASTIVRHYATRGRSVGWEEEQCHSS
jgi:hypothetical protein